MNQHEVDNSGLSIDNAENNILTTKD